MFAFFIKKMPKVWKILKPEDKEKLRRIYKQLEGKEYMPPIESLPEIDKLMREIPNPTERK